MNCKYCRANCTGAKQDREIAMCLGYDPPKTNADRIRAMSDEELAKTISGDQIYPWCTEEPCKYDSCTDCVLAWLKQEDDT